MRSPHDQESVAILVLVDLGFDHVDFNLDREGDRRPVNVRVGSGSSWRRAVIFPHGVNEAGQSTGNDDLDERIRVRACEELARLEAIVRESRAA